MLVRFGFDGVYSISNIRLHVASFSTDQKTKKKSKKPKAAVDGGGGGGGESDQDEAGSDIVSWSELFQFADGWDKLYLVVGVICAFIHGGAMPATIVLFGDIFDSFGVLLGGGEDGCEGSVATGVHSNSSIYPDNGTLMRMDGGESSGSGEASGIGLGDCGQVLNPPPAPINIDHLSLDRSRCLYSDVFFPFSFFLSKRSFGINLY